ncbi:hypothetical protein GCM10009678_43700 [Actinomadura kijaniata]
MLRSPRGVGALVTGGERRGPRVRELRTLEELAEVNRLFDRIWRPGEPLFQVELLRALSHAGNYVAGAFEGGTMVGASVAFFAEPAGEALHSHVTGALGGRGVGLALKLHQRDWALERGLRRITWTFDPLVRRNAYFNLVKLGARPEEYLPSFYGTLDDTINEGDETDRVLAVWRLAPAPAPAAAGGPVLLGDRGGRPVVRAAGADVVLVEVPADVEALRREDPAAAREWRAAVREVLGGLLAGGARVVGFHGRSAYVVDRSTGTREDA